MKSSFAIIFRFLPIFRIPTPKDIAFVILEAVANSAKCLVVKYARGVATMVVVVLIIVDVNAA